MYCTGIEQLDLEVEMEATQAIALIVAQRLSKEQATSALPEAPVSVAVPDVASDRIRRYRRALVARWT
jgi:hypothetical protein